MGLEYLIWRECTYTGLGVTLLKDLHMIGDALDVDEVDYLRAGLDFTIGRVGL